MSKPLLVAFAALLFFYSCTKIETTDIGGGLIPPVDGVNTKDTILDVVTNLFLDDQVGRVYRSDDQVIGVIDQDPLFGETVASAYFELKPEFYEFSLPGVKSSRIADSAVLILSYRGVYGDTTVPQRWNVHEIGKAANFRNDSNYTTSAAPFALARQLGSSLLDLRTFNDSVNYGLENAANQIRIPLNDLFAQRLIKQYDTSATNDLPYDSDSLFRVNFAGFAVIPDPSMGRALVRINLLDTNTKLALYHRYKAADTSSALTSAVDYFRFSLNTSVGVPVSASANLIRRDRTGAEIATYLNNSGPDQLLHIQTSPGTYASVKIPGLTGFPNKIIHRAELIAEQDVTNDPSRAFFTAPRYLLLSAFDSANNRRINLPNDYTIDETYTHNNLLTFGGFRLSKTIDNDLTSAYWFNLTRYVQGIVTRGDTNHTLRLSAPVNDSLYYSFPYPIQSATSIVTYIRPNYANNIADGRVRLGGGNHPRVRMRLRIIYSDL